MYHWNTKINMLMSFSLTVQEVVVMATLVVASSDEVVATIMVQGRMS